MAYQCPKCVPNTTAQLPKCLENAISIITVEMQELPPWVVCLCHFSIKTSHDTFQEVL